MRDQNKLLEKINSYSLSSLPHSILLVGEYGSEKEEVCNYIAERFDLQLFNITELLTKEYIDTISSSVSFGLYIIDSTKITEKDQNALLKLYEEPNDYTYIILMCESKYNILETIQTRSYELTMCKYSKEYLESLCTNKNEYALKIATTPFAVEELNHVDLDSLHKLCVNIINKMNVASYQNTLTISNKINFSDEYDKYPLWAFIKMLGYVMLETNSDLYIYLYNFNKTYEPLLDKKRYFENMLTNMWLASRRLHGH